MVSNTLELFGDYNCCIALVNKEIEIPESETVIVALSIFKQILQVKMKYPYMLCKPPVKNITENDYFRCIWSPILEAMFPPESGNIKIKSGDRHH